MFEFNVAMLFLFAFTNLYLYYTFFDIGSKKIVYLKLISDNVNDIANGKLGLTIGIKGKDELTQLAKNINYMSKELENTFEQERRLERTKMSS